MSSHENMQTEFKANAKMKTDKTEIERNMSKMHIIKLVSFLSKVRANGNE